MIYKGVYIDLECTYMPEIKQNNSTNFITDKQPCVAHLPDREGGFETVEAAKKYIDKNLKRIQKKEKMRAYLSGIPF